MLFHFPEEYPPSHLPAQERLAPQFPPLFEAIDCQDSIPEIPISIHPKLLRAVIAEDRGTRRARLSSAFIRKLVGTPQVKSVVSALKPRIQRHAAFVVKMARLVNRAINERQETCLSQCGANPAADRLFLEPQGLHCARRKLIQS